MSSSFAALMALSASQTQQSQTAVQSALAERERKEAARRKAQEEKERKERAAEAQVRLRRLEDDKREQERRARLEKERQAKEEAGARRAKEQSERLLGGKKRREGFSAADGEASGSGGGGGGGRRRVDDDDDSSAVALTREEKRERKLQAELRRELGARSGRASSSISGYGRTSRRLAGGAVDVVHDSAGGGERAGGIKARLLAMPNTLTKLNVVKRDTRTIDEILQDRARARGEVKVLDGEQAREFSDWFGTKKREAPKGLTPPKSGTSSPAPLASSSKPSLSAPIPKKPLPAASRPTPPSRPSSQPPAKSNKPPVPSFTKRSITSNPTAKPSASSKLSRPTGPAASTTPAKRRARSSSLDSEFDSYDEDEYDRRMVSSSKRRRASPDEPSASSISAQIWQMFGKDKRTYVERDVLSDDEDMEADMGALEREELRSQRIARKEDQEAEEAERRHAEEKRRRAKERR